MVKKFYDKIVLKYPITVLIAFFLAISTLAYHATKLEIDASAETLLLDDDKDLKFSREVNKRYYNPNFLVVTYTPNEDLLSKKSIDTLKRLSEELLKVEKIESITSILNVPLIQSPLRPITDLVDGVDSLETATFDMDLVKKEFLNSQLYSNNLVSADFKTTGMLLNLKNDEKYFELLEKRNTLLTKKRTSNLNEKEKVELEITIQEFKEYRDFIREKDEKEIEEIRTIIKKYNSNASIFLGGIDMIANDIVGFVKSDLAIYGSTLIFLLIFILWVIFRHPRWVVLPITICLLSVVSTAGILGLFNLEVTVISSNFISLQLIITLAIVLHLIVRYRELNVKYKNASQYKLVINTVLSKLSPSFFAIITTITGFASLVLSSIQPVKNLGLMMSAGIAVSLFIAFFVFPIILIMLPKKDEHEKRKAKSSFSLITLCASLVEKRGITIIIGSLVVILFSTIGASKLVVENSFINYFKQSTEIYKGMKVIDQKLGGTTPLDVIIKFKDDEKKAVVQVEKDEDTSFLDDEFGDFEAEIDAKSDDEQYWFSQDKMDTITRVHEYLDNLEEVGKVQSLASLLKVGKLLNQDKDLDGVMLALLYKKIPEEYKNMILAPYINIESNEARVSMRIIDSNENLRRNELIAKINKDLREIIRNKETTFQLSNLMILYNNMLQSLFDSQIKTLGIVVVLLFIMFLILFRSIKVAFIAILANVIPISSIFGIMGFLGIPLDIMTITIAAISIGIGVDDTIHYIHRFKEEFKTDHNYLNAMKRSHESIGYAMYYTSIIVMIGFSILVLSNLIPTIYFGVLTVVVMATILASALLLLPKLIIMLKPFNTSK
ncbi:MMPL family transporter [Poseidonibacter lekithochrous]|uniref:efflux RND transporter permease subunit n=1 Tax=Poseidonibacter TaxID=2321187 RepID=UPI001C090D43|nr:MULTISPECIES: MMPL family transporter [Poseidonibacter]MBU3015183.1 MMPL family transporter [Poseidonibacter lekithochrous]MDO6828480.1 MMPL family transporter [Poseidonibacter sp. 1_MG-2023]